MDVARTFAVSHHHHHRGGFEDAAVGSALASVARLDAPAPLRR